MAWIDQAVVFEQIQILEMRSLRTVKCAVLEVGELRKIGHHRSNTLLQLLHILKHMGNNRIPRGNNKTIPHHIYIHG
jgi:hypothetical protein